ncbi:MAG: response regulator [Eubacteriales bacterium]|nr:response regulator [Eubacteriales bacterium]
MSSIRTLLLDDERHALNYLQSICRECPELQIQAALTSPRKAMELILSGAVQLVIMDIEMPELSGMEIASEISRRGLPIGVIFVTGYDQYALEAYQNDAISYLLKPTQTGELARAVEKAMRLVQRTPPQVFIRTFGRFDVFVNQEPIYFSSAKAKELLAFLVDQNGGIATMDTIVSYLWEDRPYDEKVKQLYRKAVSYLNKLLQQQGLTFFVSNRGSCYIKKSEVQCDLFDLYAHRPYAKQSYSGEYMADYSWGEQRIPEIEQYLH